MKRIFKGKLLTLETVTKRLPNGYRSRLEIIRHPGAVLIIPVLNRDQYILLKQFRPVIGRYLYEFPAGTLNKNEKPLSCAKRELVEETGFKAGKMTRLGKIFPVPGYSTEEITIFKGEQLVKGKIQREKDEVMTAHIVTKKQIKHLVRSKKIQDAKTLSALALMGF